MWGDVGNAVPRAITSLVEVCAEQKEYNDPASFSAVVRFVYLDTLFHPWVGPRARTGALGDQAANFKVGCNPIREANTSSMSALKSRQAPFISADTRG
jgi:hypothetical protein